MAPLTFAYYCSGHGYGHATRVSAVASYLRNIGEVHNRPTVIIVSSAPQKVFHEAISVGAAYRNAYIDPVIVQPLAYHVDRRKSVDVLRSFLDKHETLLLQEVGWLQKSGVDCVLSDAAFLGCKAAHIANIPSVLITNFTFDSVYSYLSIAFPSSSAFSHPRDSFSLEPLDDTPIPIAELRPLVRVLHEGYRCASLLLRLPGYIPIPSFGVEPALPAHLWTDPASNRFLPGVAESLRVDAGWIEVLPPLNSAGSNSDVDSRQLERERKIVQAPLIVRHPSPDIYTPAGRLRVLSSIGIPPHLQSHKILVVSFGGQIFRKPQSHAASRSHSPTTGVSRSSSAEPTSSLPSSSSLSPPTLVDVAKTDSQSSDGFSGDFVHVSTPVATASHLWVPGAPPVLRTPTVTTSDSSKLLNDKTPRVNGDSGARSEQELFAKMPRVDLGEEGDSAAYATCDGGSGRLDDYGDLGDHVPAFLPDDTWIAIVCGAVPSKSIAEGEGDDDLPPNFFLAHPSVYMLDLLALSAVALGKLGYGTTSECISTSTPLVFVPRPLFVEEHGLRRLLEEEGPGVELSQDAYERGEWAAGIREAWESGRAKKEERWRKGDDGSVRKDGEEMARGLVRWVEEWKAADLQDVQN